MLLGHPAHEGIRRGEPDRAGLLLVDTGEQHQKRRLPRTVGADEANDIARRDSQVESIEQGAMTLAVGEPLGHESCGHLSILSSAGAIRG